MWEKVGMLVAILASSVVMGFLPLALKKVAPAKQKRLMSFGNAFAGGVFFAIGYVARHCIVLKYNIIHYISQHHHLIIIG